MKNNIIFSAVLILVAVIGQIFLMPIIMVNDIKPDFFAIAITITALVVGGELVLVAAFAGGLLFDAVGLLPLGSSALAYVIGAYIIAFFRNRDYDQPFNFFVILIVGILVIRTAIAITVTISGDSSFSQYYFRQVIPEVVYSFFLAGIIYFFARDYISQSAMSREDV
jgi:rod shape-determining protein MreD